MDGVIFERDGGRERPTLGGGVQSVEVAGQVLRAVLDAGGPARLSDLARATELPTAKARRYLISLIRAGLVDQDPDSGRYDLGPMAQRIGLAAFARIDILERAERAVRQLVEQTGESAAIGIMGPTGPKLVRMREGRGRAAYLIPPGHVCPMTYSATGVTFSALGRDVRVDQLIKQELAQNRRVGRDYAPASEEALAEKVAQVHRDGCAIVPSAGADGRVSAIAAPVYDAAGDFSFTLTLFAHQGRLNLDPEGPLIRLLLDSARDLSRSAGR